MPFEQEVFDNYILQWSKAVCDSGPSDAYRRLEPTKNAELAYATDQESVGLAKVALYELYKQPWFVGYMSFVKSASDAKRAHMSVVKLAEEALRHDYSHAHPDVAQGYVQAAALVLETGDDLTKLAYGIPASWVQEVLTKQAREIRVTGSAYNPSSPSANDSETARLLARQDARAREMVRLERERAATRAEKDSLQGQIDATRRKIDGAKQKIHSANALALGLGGLGVGALGYGLYRHYSDKEESPGQRKRASELPATSMKTPASMMMQGGMYGARRLESPDKKQMPKIQGQGSKAAQPMPQNPR